MNPMQKIRRTKQDNRHPDQAAEANAIHSEVLGRLRFALSKTGPKAFREVIIAYLREAESRIAQMNLALSQSNLPELQIAVHTLKSSSALVGAADLSRLCQEFEVQVWSAVEHSINMPPNAYEMFSNIQAEYNRVEIALETELLEE
jgi:HPt (histidine-containing phosphotransfer) domain-containing protein